MSTCHTTYIVLGAEGSEVQAAATATREELARAGVRGAHSHTEQEECDAGEHVEGSLCRL